MRTAKESATSVTQRHYRNCAATYVYCIGCTDPDDEIRSRISTLAKRPPQRPFLCYFLWPPTFPPFFGVSSSPLSPPLSLFDVPRHLMQQDDGMDDGMDQGNDAAVALRVETLSAEVRRVAAAVHGRPIQKENIPTHLSRPPRCFAELRAHPTDVVAAPAIVATVAGRPILLMILRSVCIPAAMMALLFVSTSSIKRCLNILLHTVLRVLNATTRTELCS